MKKILFILLLFTIACQTHSDPGINKMEIARVLFDQQNAWNRGDIEGYMQGYVNTDSLRFASGGAVTYGWLTTLERYRKGYPDKESMGELAFTDIDITLISKDAALVFGKWELERAFDHPEGLFTLLFKKTNGNWKIVHDHTSAASEK